MKIDEKDKLDYYKSKLKLLDFFIIVFFVLFMNVSILTSFLYFEFIYSVGNLTKMDMIFNFLCFLFLTILFFNIIILRIQIIYKGKNIINKSEVIE